MKALNQYTVHWYIDIEAETPEDAARRALEIQRDPESTAVVFSIYDEGDNLVYDVDLQTED